MAALLLGCAAWTKNEGLVCAGVIFVNFLITTRRLADKSLATGVMAALVLFILPWTAFRMINRIEVYDFSWTPVVLADDEAINRIHQIIKAFAKYFMHVPRTGGIWLIVVCGLIVQICRRKSETRQSRFLLLSAALIACAYVMIFLFSTRPLYWHLKAVERIMLTPALIALFSCTARCFRLNSIVLNSKPHQSHIR